MMRSSSSYYQIIKLLIAVLDYTPGSVDRHTVLFNYEKVLPDLQDFDIPRFVRDAAGFINDLPSPRFIKSHLPFHLLPHKLQRGLTQAKVGGVDNTLRKRFVAFVCTAAQDF